MASSNIFGIAAQKGLENLQSVYSSIGRAEDWLDDKFGVSPELKQVANQAIDSSPVGMGTIVDLAKYSKSFNSEKDFIENSPILYHGSKNEKIKELMANDSETGKAIFLSDNPLVAEEYGPQLYDVALGTSKIKKINWGGKEWFSGNMSAEIKKAKEEGYDAVKFENIKDAKFSKYMHGNTYAVINPDKATILDTINTTSDPDWYLKESRANSILKKIYGSAEEFLDK